MTARSGELHTIVRRSIERRDAYLDAVASFGTPQYLLEASLLHQQVHRFRSAFTSAGLAAHAHYAFKANPTLPVLKEIKAAGLSADVSSGIELAAALAIGFEHIVFSGPGKTDEELRLAVENLDRVTVHVDSFAEVARLNDFADASGKVARVGVRLNTEAHGLWTKFGIPLKDLSHMLTVSRDLSSIRVEGVQFHLSWNRQSDGYVETLKVIGPVLNDHSPATGWRFVDIGGGFYPEDDEGAYPWVAGGQVAPTAGPSDDWDLKYLLQDVAPIEQVASDIGDAFSSSFPEGPELWVEPGRYLVNPAVHILLRVVDVKGEALAITDGGTNLLGWERLELEHCPLVNLTRPSEQQRRMNVYGSLCTPHDLWGYTCYGESIRPGDVLMVPAQGSYVQTLAQRFIKPICQTVLLGADGSKKRVAAAETAHDRYPELFLEREP